MRRISSNAKQNRPRANQQYINDRKQIKHIVNNVAEEKLQTIYRILIEKG